MDRENRQKIQPVRKLLCPNCKDFIPNRYGKVDYCHNCQWEGRVCRTCGNEKKLRFYRESRQKETKKGIVKIKSAIPRLGYDCKRCRDRSFNKKQRDSYGYRKTKRNS